MPMFQLETALFISLLGAMFYYFGKVIDETTPKQSEDFHLYVMGVFFVAGYILLPAIIWFEFLKEQTWFLWPLFNPIVTIAIQFIIGTGILVYVMMKYRAKTHITRSSDKDKVVAGLSSFLLSFLFVTPILASLVSNQIFSMAFYMVMGFFGMTLLALLIGHSKAITIEITVVMADGEQLNGYLIKQGDPLRVSIKKDGEIHAYTIPLSQVKYEIIPPIKDGLEVGNGK